MNIAELRKLAIQTIEIPGFSPGTTVTVQVQQPRIMALMAQGKIPNPLMSVATKIVMSEKSDLKVDAALAMKIYELYCTACLVEPTYNEFKDIITDEQMLHIYLWATGELQQLSRFRPDAEDGSSDSDGEGVPSKAE